MADGAAKKSSSVSSKKGVAIAKRAKISSAQKNMLIAVGVTSMLLGVTVVGVIYLMKKISFNSLVISENDATMKDLKDTQNNLVTLSDAVKNLASNEKLEVVAMERDDIKCNRDVLRKIQSEDGTYDTDNIEIVRTCSALRVIADTLPSSYNQEASNSSINWLLLHKNQDIKIEGISTADNITGYVITGDDGNQMNLKTIGSSITINDSATKVSKAISSIENSIRNFDIESASIRWSSSDRGASDSTIEYSATYRSYYSDKVGLQKNTKLVCADKTSQKCMNAGGSSAQ